MRVLTRRIAFLALAGTLAGCSLQSASTTSPNIPTGTVTITEPAGGESYQIGDTVPLAWSCPDCTNVPTGDYLQVFAYDGQAAYLVYDQAQMTDSTTWVVGTSLQNVSLLPGTYVVTAQDVDGYYQAQSRFFSIVAATQ